MGTVIVLFCGGRSFDNAKMARQTVTDLVNRHGVFSGFDREVSLVIHGGQRGADHLAGLFSSRMNLEVKVYRAEWTRHGKAAGPIRNQRMIDEGKPDLVVAFPGGKGTRTMIELARKAGIRVILIGEHER